jgi:proteasome lid subunit RPN8/RPN11
MPSIGDDSQVADDGISERFRAPITAYFESLEERSNVNLVPNISTLSPKLFWRSIQMLYKQAVVYQNELDLQTSYILYLRLCKTVLTSKLSNPNGDLKLLVKGALTELEKIKPLLVEAVIKEVKKRDEVKRKESLEQLEESKRQLAKIRLQQQKDGHLYYKIGEDKTSIPLFEFPELFSGPRRLRVPKSLIDQFALIAHSNTQNGIETCGVLAGKLILNELCITSLIVPKQVGSKDTCNMTHEEQLVQVQDENELLALGWIHTHPTQALFLSSVDVHTQYGFQALLDEAIAVVLAPRYEPNWGVFRLKRLDAIAKCQLTGFHKHPLRDEELYSRLEAGPLLEWTNEQIQLFDLR